MRVGIRGGTQSQPEQASARLAKFVFGRDCARLPEDNPSPMRIGKMTLSLLPATLLLAVRAPAADTYGPVTVEVPVVHLWEGGAPGFESLKDVPEVAVKWGVARINNPSVAVFLPPPGKATGAAVLIIPGGGHRFLNIAGEGYALGRWLAEKGVACFVLKYRLAKDQAVEHSPYRIDVEEVQDARRALRLVRSRAAGWGVDPLRIGVLGFSAGGRLAARLGMTFDSGYPASADPVDRSGSRPAFQCLVYPGEPEEIVPTKDSPPAFLVAGMQDDLADGLITSSLRFKRAGVPVELHVYTGVGHAFNFRTDDSRPVGSWAARFYDWLAYSGFLSPPKQS
jgi:acetyl esterase/lipase